MHKSIFKVFFSHEKETDWLNRLGKQGYLLCGISDSKYLFEINDGVEYKYSIEHLDCSPKSDSAVEYFKSREDIGVTPVLSSGNWVYFVSSGGDIECTVDICTKNARFYFWRIIYLLFFSVCGAVLCGYHIFSVGYLQSIDQMGSGRLELLTGGSSLLGAIKTGVNYIFKAINAYFDIWTDIFGKNDAVATVSVIIPVVLILIVLATFNLDSYIGYIKKKRSLIRSEIPVESEGANDAE